MVTSGSRRKKLLSLKRPCASVVSDTNIAGRSEEIIIEEVKPTEEVKSKKVKKVIKKVIEESESEEEIVEQVIIKKKSNNNKPLTNNEKLKLVEQTAEERLKESLKNDRLNYLLNQIGCKL